MDRVKLFLLGLPRIERDGSAVDVDTRKAIALAAYLAVTRQSHSRDALAALLWPEYDEVHGRSALRRTLSVLNKALGGDKLDVDREAIGLKAGADLWLDVDEFRGHLARCQAGEAPPAACATCLTPLIKAAALYRGDFLAGFTLRDSAEFDDWQFFQTESLRRELMAGLEQLVVCYTAQGELKLAIDYARRWLALDPWHETAHQHLMRLYVWDGQRSAALRQYQECTQMLEQELGVAPQEETTALYQAIKSGQLASRAVTPALPSVPPPPSEAAARSMYLPDSYPLVGRATEWEALRAAYGTIAASGSAGTGSATGRLVVLEGEAGIGKTRLAAEFAAAVRSGGARALVARCYQGEANLSYGPFIEVLRAAPQWPAHVPAHWLAEAARLLPERATADPNLPPTPPLDSPGAQSRFFEGVRQVLLALLDGPAPGVLMIDELQWADPASLDLLAYLVRRLRGQPICLLVTWRAEDAPPGGRLRLLVAEAERAGLGVAVPLTRLSEAAVAELLQVVSPGDVPDGLRERLYRESEGLPLFVVEYLAAAVISGLEEALPTGEWVLPRAVRDLLHARLAVVGDAGRRALAAAAVVGRSFDLNLVASIADLGEEETVDALEDMVAHGIVQEVRAASSPLYDFRHEKLRAVVYDEMGLARRRLLHLRAARALSLRPRAGQWAGQIAGHYRLAGHIKAAAEYYRLAADHARRLYANTQALAHYRAALELGHPADAALHEAIGDLLTLAGEYDDALTAYELASTVAEPDGMGRLEHKLGGVYHRLGVWDEAERRYQAALVAVGDVTGGQVARIETDRSLNAHRQGQSERAAELAHRARERAELAGDRLALAQAHNVLGILATSRHDAVRARRHLEQSLALAEELDDLGAQAAALNNLALAYRRTGELGRALELAKAALALCIALGDRHREAALHSNLADLLHEAGEAEAARAHVSHSVTILAEIGGRARTWQPEIWKLVEW